MERVMWEGLLRVLTYALTMPQDPMGHVDSAFKGGIDRGALGCTPQQYLEAIQTGLASDVDLSATIGLEPHTDAVVRRYLEAVRDRLVRELDAAG